MAMLNCVTVRNQPDGVVVPRYRNLQTVPFLEVVKVGALWYLHGVSADRSDFYFGDRAGYASEAAATTAIVAILP